MLWNILSVPGHIIKLTYESLADQHHHALTAVVFVELEARQQDSHSVAKWYI